MKSALFCIRNEKRRGRRGSEGFTLIELLIVIGLLGALATLLMTGLKYTRTEALDDALVQKELADIQRVFQRFAADCVLQQDDYKLIAKYGLAPLMQYDDYLTGGDSWSFDEWDNERRAGWRGPYINYEAEEAVDISINYSNPATFGQPPLDGGTTVTPVVCTPYRNDKHDPDYYTSSELYQVEHGDYYRVIPEMDGSDVDQLWVVFPSHSGTLVLETPDPPDDPSGVRGLKYKRQLMLD